MKLKDSTYQAQSALSTYCRNGVLQPIEGAVEERLPHYRRLVYNVVKGALDTAYPVAKKYLESNWQELQFRFFSNHACSDPQIWKMPEELIEYIGQHEPQLSESHPVLLDLLRFEWQETYLYMMPDIAISKHSDEKPEMSDIPVIDPEMQILVLKYPVHTTAPEKINIDEQKQHVSLGYRDRSTGKVHFMDLSVYFALFMDTITSKSVSVEEAGKTAALMLGLNEETLWRDNLEKFITKLHSKNLIFKR